tara:strand:+ start:269 stop:496 length:228 start_codon:yes stop_codon:yes gene_type:complete
MYKALLAHFHAQREEALAVLHLYLSQPVGVADHSNILKELVDWTKKLSEAEEQLECLKRNINFNNPTNENNQDQK